jgi:hypothetical protein
MKNFNVPEQPGQPPCKEITRVMEQIGPTRKNEKAERTEKSTLNPKHLPESNSFRQKP